MEEETGLIHETLVQLRGAAAGLIRRARTWEADGLGGRAGGGGSQPLFAPGTQTTYHRAINQRGSNSGFSHALFVILNHFKPPLFFKGVNLYPELPAGRAY